MDEKTQHNIFDRFYQGDNSRSLEGNGLELPLVKKIIELHHERSLSQAIPEKGALLLSRSHLQQASNTNQLSFQMQYPRGYIHNYQA